MNRHIFFGILFDARRLSQRILIVGFPHILGLSSFRSPYIELPAWVAASLKLGCGSSTRGLRAFSCARGGQLTRETHMWGVPGRTRCESPPGAFAANRDNYPPLHIPPSTHRLTIIAGKNVGCAFLKIGLRCRNPPAGRVALHIWW